MTGADRFSGTCAQSASAAPARTGANTASLRQARQALRPRGVPMAIGTASSAAGSNSRCARPWRPIASMIPMTAPSTIAFARERGLANTATAIGTTEALGT
jgi:hypothetical protein